MVVAYLRNKMYLKAVGSGVLAFFASPLDFIKQVFGFLARIIKRK